MEYYTSISAPFASAKSPFEISTSYALLLLMPLLPLSHFTKEQKMAQRKKSRIRETVVLFFNIILFIQPGRFQ